MTDLVALAAEALANARRSREPEALPTIPHLPVLALPEPLLPRHLGRYDGLLPDFDDERTDMNETAGLLPGQRERAGVPV